MERERGKKKTDQKDILIGMSSEKDTKEMWQPELERLLISLSLIDLTRSHVLLMMAAAQCQVRLVRKLRMRGEPALAGLE